MSVRVPIKPVIDTREPIEWRTPVDRPIRCQKCGLMIANGFCLHYIVRAESG